MSIGDHPNPHGYPPTMTISRPRSDGKYPVKFHYPTAGRTFRKLLTEEQVRKELAGDHRVIWDYPHIQRPFLDVIDGGNGEHHPEDTGYTIA